MPHDQIRQTLADLREQLKTNDDLADALRTSLLETIDHVDQALAVEPSESETREPGSLKDRLTEYALEFEETHPGVAKTLHSLIDTLAQMGI